VRFGKNREARNIEGSGFCAGDDVHEITVIEGILEVVCNERTKKVKKNETYNLNKCRTDSGLIGWFKNLLRQPWEHIPAAQLADELGSFEFVLPAHRDITVNKRPPFLLISPLDSQSHKAKLLQMKDDDETFEPVSEISIKDSILVRPNIDLLRKGESSKDYKIDLYGEFRLFTVVSKIL